MEQQTKLVCGKAGNTIGTFIQVSDSPAGIAKPFCFQIVVSFFFFLFLLAR